MSGGRAERATFSCVLGICGTAAVAVSLAASFGRPAQAETRTYAISLFGPAAYSQKLEDDCPKGLNPAVTENYRQNLKDIGIAPEDIEKILLEYNGDSSTPATLDALANRGRIDGKPANAYTHPLSVPHAPFLLYEGRYAFGFDLDGKGAASPESFKDPETQEAGIDNEWARATGCVLGLRAAPPALATAVEFRWVTLQDSLPAWIVTLSGDDLSKDGEATVAFDIALEHVARDANSDVRRYWTFRLDPDRQWHFKLRGRIENGTFISEEAGDLLLKGDPYYFWKFDLRRARLRLDLTARGDIEGYLGGYQPWRDIYFMFGSSGYLSEGAGVDMPALYRTLVALADGDPDPETKRNSSISITYRIKAVPAMVVAPPDDEVRISEAAGSVRGRIPQETQQ